MSRAKFVLLFILIVVLTSCTTVQAAEPKVENLNCPYKLPWPSTLSAVKVGQSISDPTNRSHKPKTLEEFAIDFSLPEGTNVLAAMEGTLSGYHDGETKRGNDSSFAKYTNYVVIKHDNGDTTYYGHLKSTVFSEGDVGQRRIMQGELIGKSGNTGWSEGPHLHFQVQTREDNIGQSKPFCLFEVNEGIPKLNKWYISSNIPYGQIAQEEGKEVGQPISGLPTGEISFMTGTRLAYGSISMEDFVVHNLANGAEIKKNYVVTLRDDYDWSRDGKWFVDSRGIIFNFETFTGEPEEGIESKLPDEFAQSGGYSWKDISWTSVGGIDYLLFVCRYNEGRAHTAHGICLMKIENAETVSLALTDGFDGTNIIDYKSPSLTNDGKTMVFLIKRYSVEPNGQSFDSLMAFSVETGEFREIDISEEIDINSVKISPNGRKIAFSGSNEAGYNIWVMNVDGSDPQNIVHGESIDPLDWSPDSGWLVFDKLDIQNQQTDIWIVNVNSGKEIQITKTPDLYETNPAWRP